MTTEQKKYDVQGMIKALEKANENVRTLEATKWKAPAVISEISLNIREEQDNEKITVACGYFISRKAWFEQGAQFLGLKTYKPLTFEGATVDDILADLKLKFEINNQHETSTRLKELLEKAQSFISEEEKKEIFFKEASDFLGSADLLALGVGTIEPTSPAEVVE